MPDRRAEPTEAEKNQMAASHPGLYKPGCVGLFAPALLILLVIFGGLLGGVALWLVAPLIGLVLVCWALYHFSFSKRRKVTPSDRSH